MTSETCEHCQGRGIVPDAVTTGPLPDLFAPFHKCQTCHGYGRVARSAYSPESAIGAPDEVDQLKAEVDRLRAFEAWLDAFEAQTRALPVQAEDQSKGCSIFNWNIGFVRQARAALGRVAA